MIPTPETTNRIFGRYRPIIPEFIPTHSLTGAELRTYKTPVVYVWKRGNEWLYVGCSYRGIQRVADVGHHVMKRGTICNTDSILMMYNLTTSQARLLEYHLIETHKPRYNNKPQLTKGR